MVDPGMIKPYWNNPRNNKEAVEVVASSLKQFGFRQPIVVDKDGVIVVGDTRYRASLKLGMKEIPIHIAEDLSPAQIRAYRIADNKTSEHATWDDAKLMQEIEELSESFPDLTSLGFTEAEIAKMNEKKEDLDLSSLVQDYEFPPIEGENWILIRATQSDCAAIMNAIKKIKLDHVTHMEFSGDPKINSKDQKK